MIGTIVPYNIQVEIEKDPDCMFCRIMKGCQEGLDVHFIRQNREKTRHDLGL